MAGTAAPPPAPEPGAFDALGSPVGAAPRLATFHRPTASWISSTRGRWSVSSANSTRREKSGPRRRPKRPSPTLKNGALPKRGSSATSRSLRTTAGSGRTEREREENFTGRPSAWVADWAISVWTCGLQLVEAVGGCTPEAVDALPVVAHHHEAAALGQ